MKQKLFSLVRTLVFLLTTGVAVSAEVSDVLFKVEVSGPQNKPLIRVTNLSPSVDINRFEMTIGHPNYVWVGNPANLGEYHTEITQPAGSGAAATLVEPSVATGLTAFRSSTLKLNCTNFGPGASFSIALELWHESGSVTSGSRAKVGDTEPGWSSILFNNGSQLNNSVITVRSGASAATVTIPENPPLQAGKLTITGPNRKLRIRSESDSQDINAADHVEAVKFVNIKVNDVLVPGGPFSLKDFGSTEIVQGDKIEISAPQIVYKDIHGVDITSSVLNNPDDIKHKAEEKFTAIGISVNNIAQTGDPTLYRFEMEQDTEVVVKWDHEYALTVRSDFSKTQSLEILDGRPWAGPLESDANGGPEPPVNKHWIKRGDAEIATIDGQYVDGFSHPGLDIRYVVKGYRAYGPPNDQVDSATNLDRFLEKRNIDIRTASGGTVLTYTDAAGKTKVTTSLAHGLAAGNMVTITGSAKGVYDGDHEITVDSTTSFTIPVPYNAVAAASLAKGLWKDSTYLKFIPFAGVEQRQQVRTNFSMVGPGGITWVWEIQYGVRVATDDVSRKSLAKIYEVMDPSDPTKDVERTAQDGVAWFDPGARIRVVAAAREPKADGMALAGWINGDGYYFAGTGVVDTSTGALTSGTPQIVNSAPVATWLPIPAAPNQPTSSTNLGFEISSLQRPVRALWRYDIATMELQVTIGKHVFEDRPDLAALYTEVDPEPIADAVPAANVTAPGGANAQMGSLMAEWDPVSRRLYPTIPGSFTVKWKSQVDSTNTTNFKISATLPFDSKRNISGHYPHVVDGPPVAIDPEANDDMAFKSIKFSTSDASVDGDKLFRATKKGFAVLLFSQIQRVGRGQPRQFLKVRVVDSRLWNEAGKTTTVKTIGAVITDSYDAVNAPNGADRANLGTGFLFNPNSNAATPTPPKGRYNPYIYDVQKLAAGLAAKDIYDMSLLRADASQLKVLNKNRLPGPIIPVNSQPNAVESDYPIVIWYDDPRLNDTILWPYLTRVYVPEWPQDATIKDRIVIASQYGSESKDGVGNDQLVAAASGAFAAATTFDPTRFESVQIYSQPDRGQPGYNPNEEHALIAPSLRFADVSPRPPAVYALRTGDLNSASETAPGYTSKPYVLVQFYDNAVSDYRMKLYRILKESAAGETPSYKFANLANATTATALNLQPHVKMKAGEPVNPFYPLGVVIGASPSKNTFGFNLLGQDTYWEDYKKTSWAASGGDNAWFSVSFFYPLAPDFYWPQVGAGVASSYDLKVPSRITRSRVGTQDGVLMVYSGASLEELEKFDTAGYTGASWLVPQTGDSVAFLPNNVNNTNDSKNSLEANQLPKPILYKAAWPDNPAILKAGETLTFSGGENRADNPTTIITRNGVTETLETPGLPQLLAFASAEVIFDSVNPTKTGADWPSKWTARVVQTLDKRTISYRVADFPSELQPASGRVRIKNGKYIFNDLPASLQRRLRYDPLATREGKDSGGNTVQVQGVLEFIGLLNDKEIGNATLTASPPAVYVLEPNIITVDERDQIKAIVKDATAAIAWGKAVDALYLATRNPDAVNNNSPYLAGLMKGLVTDSNGGIVKDELGNVKEDANNPIVPLRAYGPGLALVPNGDFLDPTNSALPIESWITVVENNDPKFGGSPITPHIIKVDRRKRYRGAIQTILSDNVFDENIILRHTGDFGANADKLVFEWWYRPDGGENKVPPPDKFTNGQTNPWKLFPDPTGKAGVGRYQITLKGNPNAPEALLADTFWFCRYRHKNDTASGSNWAPNTTSPTGTKKYDWAGAGNSDPFHDLDLDGYFDYQAQLAMGWIKRVLDGVNPYEARIRNFDGDNPATVTSMIQQFGARYEGAVALNPDKNVIENVGLIELYETILRRGKALSIDLTQPVSTPAISNALQLASTRLADFYTLLGNEAYTDALDPTIGFGSDSVDYGSLAPAVHAFQNQSGSLIEEELSLLRGVDAYYARPVYNRLFWNFTKGEGEAAYAMNYNISDINQDGFINEDDAMILYPQGHGDAWGHYLTALTNQYELLKDKNFNWVSRSESYNLQDIVIKVDFLDERKFAATAAAKAKAGAEIVSLTYRDKFVADPNAQWQGYTDSNKGRAWGVEEWSRRAGQGAYFDWVTANAMLPSEHPNKTLEGIQKVDRSTNSDIAVISANLNAIQGTIDQANKGYNPLGLARGAQIFDIDPTFLEVGSTAQIGTRAVQGLLHFDQIFERAIKMMDNVATTWDNANESRNMLRQLGNTETEFRNATFQEDLDYRNRLIAIFGKPYEGNIGPGKMYPAGYEGPDLALYMYVPVREITKDTVPGPAASWATFKGKSGALSGGDLYNAFVGDDSSLPGSPDGSGDAGGKEASLSAVSADIRKLFTASFSSATDNLKYDSNTTGGLFAVNYTDLTNPKVAFENYTNQMPIKASGYTFQAPASWGSRKATGELQALVGQMIQQEAEIARAIGEWDSLSGEIVRILRLINSRMTTSGLNQKADEQFARAKYGIQTAIGVIEVAYDIYKKFKEKVVTFNHSVGLAVPRNLLTAGLSVSPGDALSLVASGIDMTGAAVVTALEPGEVALKITKLAAEIGLSIAEAEVGLSKANEERNLSIREWLKELEDKAGDEPIKRIAIFKEMQALRELSDRYRSLLDEGGRLVDERAAYNKRVAAATQSRRYQDMTFRVARNFALQTYRQSFDLAARYAYLATAAYDYETNYLPTDPGSAQPYFNDIVRARSLGQFVDGQPRLGAGGISAALATVKSNYESQKGQLGFNNVQRESGELSLRTQLFRIFAKGDASVPAGGAVANEFPAPGQDSDALWKQKLQNARVDDLWDLPEYRYYCRPFQSEADASGNHVQQPGIVIRFGSEITAGKNFFGRPLAGGDFAYNSSDFATKIVGAGIFFSDYDSGDVLSGLASAPRVYLLPIGLDVMRIPHSSNSDDIRTWNVVDQAIPVPIPATSSSLQQSGYIPLLDSLNGKMGEQRKFPSFRAYHNGTDSVTNDFGNDDLAYDARLVGRSIWNTQWMLIIPGKTLNADPNEGLNRLVDQISDILLIFDSYGQSGG